MQFAHEHPSFVEFFFKKKIANFMYTEILVCLNDKDGAFDVYKKIKSLKQDEHFVPNLATIYGFVHCVFLMSMYMTI